MKYSIKLTASATEDLEEADDFDKEVELLGKSEKFQRFLNDRAKEPGITTLNDYRRSLN